MTNIFLTAYVIDTNLSNAIIRTSKKNPHNNTGKSTFANTSTAFFTQPRVVVGL